MLVQMHHRLLTISSRIIRDPQAFRRWKTTLTFGTRLQSIIERETNKHMPCSACRQEVQRLNRLTREAAAADRNRIVEGIVIRGRESLGWWNPKRWAIALAPAQVKECVQLWLQEAIDGASERNISADATVTNRHLLTEAEFQIARGVAAGVSRKDVLNARRHWRESGIPLPPLESRSASGRVTDKSGRSNTGLRSERVGTALKSRMDGVLSITSGKGCGCTQLADEMDIWGINGCNENRQYIVDRLVSSREALANAVACSESAAQSALAVLKGLPIAQHEIIVGAEMLAFLNSSSESLQKAALAAGAEWLLNAAIEDVRNQKQQDLREMRLRHMSPPPRREYTGWKSDADGPRPKLGPFESMIRHFTYHVWPTHRHEGWKWNLEEVARRWALFNGVRVLAIAHDSETVSPDTVLEFAGSLRLEFDHVLIRPNDSKRREGATWVPMLQLLHPETAGPDEVVFSAHAKGVRHTEENRTRDWTDLMYRLCLDEWPNVEEQLRSTIVTGAFKRFGQFGMQDGYNWDYSGTFFWWRLQELGRRDWRSIHHQFFGTESWPGRHCSSEEAGCLFLNDCKDLYNVDYWTNTVWPAWHARMGVNAT